MYRPGVNVNGAVGPFCEYPAFLKVQNDKGEDWCMISMDTHRSNTSFQIENYNRTDEKDKFLGDFLVRMSPTMRTETKFGKELGEGEEFYWRGPMKTSDSKDGKSHKGKKDPKDPKS